MDGSYHLAIFSIKPISQNEELTWDYNFASFGEPKPCLCGAPNCRKVLAGKPQREETPQVQLTAKGQQTQREAAAAEAFRRRVVVGKPQGDMSDVVLFFNGRTSKMEMARVCVCMWLRGGYFPFWGCEMIYIYLNTTRTLNCRRATAGCG